ncbi:MAG: threonine--tRNA ligase [Firmicutes bacterium]|nr:threonine--tRNA ligase [Bacillota bacterium]
MQSLSDVLQRSTAILLAHAVHLHFSPEIVRTGDISVTGDGFYCDFDLPRPIRPDDLEKIDNQMRRFIQDDLPLQAAQVDGQQVEEMLVALGETLLCERLPSKQSVDVVDVCSHGPFVTLSEGDHVESAGQIAAFRLLTTGAVYWKGDAKSLSLQRIHGFASASVDDLNGHLAYLEESKRRDHRKLGPELDLFLFLDEAPGMPVYLPGGLIIRTQLEQFERDLQRAAGYQEVRTPLMMNRRLWEESGHWEHYRDNMYFIDVEDGAPVATEESDGVGGGGGGGARYALKPMNCPGHMLIYKRRPHSWRDLPVRLSEHGQVHRHELSGALHGLLRVRTFTQDDAHLFVRPDQIESEINSVIRLIDQVYKVFGFTVEVELSTRPADSMGSDAEWTQAETSLANVLKALDLAYRINPGDGAFYGPKIDFHIRDALGRRWQCATIQLDFQMPEKFDLEYIGENNERLRPVVIHRAIFGSVDRFLGILTEHYAGVFPLWLAPEQVRVLPVASAFVSYAKAVVAALTTHGLRASVDARDEKLGYKIRDASVHKVPYVVVVGAAEAANWTVSVRSRAGRLQENMPLHDLIARAEAQVASRL